MSNVKSKSSKKTQKQIARLNRVFNACDKNHSGAIEGKELQFLIRRWYRPTNAEVAAFMRQFDLDDNRACTFDEYVKALTTFKTDSGESVTVSVSDRMLEEIRRDFDRLDLDKSGELDLDEIRHVCRRSYVAPPVVVDKFKQVLDLNVDGKITLSELVAAFDKVREKHEELFSDEIDVSSDEEEDDADDDDKKKQASASTKGGVSTNVRDGDDESQAVLDAIADEVAKKLNLKPGTKGRVLQYTTQVVNGMNFFLKVRFGDKSLHHVRAHRSFTREVTLHSVQRNKSVSDALEYF
eukprot:TRINITY_DN67692_c3_g2_i1.p1 TRINITY_DN67692_c3_g2~~TRINITY_DN67692_c3_g2_i1.p1  ORF type:complete len:295 (-),score=192.80 TRINITY_DN67692_c3_g2_i1:1018-1902(-)